MNDLGPWTTEDYDELSWHDVHVHGFRFDNFKPDNGSADLILDIDYILKWDNSSDHFLFTVCRAELRFHDVFGLTINVDYATPTAGMCPFSIDGIERELLEFSPGHTSYRWRIPVNWPSGQLEFQAPSFVQQLMGEPREQTEQALMTDGRNDQVLPREPPKSST